MPASRFDKSEQSYCLGGVLQCRSAKSGTSALFVRLCIAFTVNVWYNRKNAMKIDKDEQQKYGFSGRI